MLIKTKRFELEISRPVGFYLRFGQREIHLSRAWGKWEGVFSSSAT